HPLHLDGAGGPAPGRRPGRCDLQGQGGRQHRARRGHLAAARPHDGGGSPMNSKSGNFMSGTILRLAYMLKGVWAILAALIVGAGLVLLAGANPIDTYAALFSGAFLDYYGLGSTLVRMSPL